MKSLTRFYIISFLLACFSYYSCHDTQTVIKGCCENPPVSGNFGYGWIWIPNVFTPNGDGIHDAMVIFGDSIHQIINLEIRNKHEFLVYTISHIPLIHQAIVWDGKTNGRVEKGLYSFTLEVEAISGEVVTFSGHICNCPCDQMGDEDFKPVSNCEFGLCDPNINDCYEFEPLPCFQH